MSGASFHDPDRSEETPFWFPGLHCAMHGYGATEPPCGECAYCLANAEIKSLRSKLRLAQFKVDILTNNEAVHLARLRKVDPEWVAAEARIAEDEAWWDANGKAELIAHLREHGLTIAGGEAS